LRAESRDDEDNPTVYETRSNGSDELGTVPGVSFAKLEIHPADEPSRELSIGPSAMIGRSRRAGNDIVFASDGMVSRRHARIEMEPDGRFTVYDLDTTNGTYVNGEKVQNRALSDGDEIRIGSTRIVFHQDQVLASVGASTGEYKNGSGSNGHASSAKLPSTSRARLVLEASGEPVDEYMLGGETVIGRGVTNDIVLADRAVAVRHVKIQRGSPWTIEALDGNAIALLNNQPLAVASPAKLAHGDELALGPVTLRFEEVAE
jgi:pSer/pThr/pTyr-binding forkhead associated (FHA) protein